jgi:hypothetical protein
MSFIEIFTLFASGVTLFGLIVGVFWVYNGRMTWRELSALPPAPRLEPGRPRFGGRRF